MRGDVCLRPLKQNPPRPDHSGRRGTPLTQGREKEVVEMIARSDDKLQALEIVREMITTWREKKPGTPLDEWFRQQVLGENHA